MRKIDSEVTPTHQDFELLVQLRNSFIQKVGGEETLRSIFPILIRETIDLVIDPVRTGRTRFEQLDNVEKTFIGLKVEHALRDLLDVPKGLRDLVLDGVDVDVKNTVRDTWTIPPETYRNSEPCFLVASDEMNNQCWLGIIVAREEYLTKTPNRDGKKSVSAAGFKNILWILNGVIYPKSRWLDIDIERFRELRRIRGGTKRAILFFRENLGRPIHRSVIEMLLFDQKDYMKRIRENGGARDQLRKENIAVLSGLYDPLTIKELGYQNISADEHIAIHAEAADQQEFLRHLNLID
ncbi:MAG: NaeI family type II restriction endonuclease [Pseudomonadota bacterium]